MTVYKKKKSGNKLSTKKKAIIEELEKEFSYDDIMLWRRLAAASILRDSDIKKDKKN